ncbi:DUF4430 domain-containing protein [Oceanobacillus sp. M65]|uniref:DUF4430 domain-containing protein n=1 Tax=Oceanobacillus sp. M65 TaxID=3457435 RepID=UPI003FCC7E44
MRRYTSLLFMIGLIVFIAFGCAKDEVTPANGEQPVAASEIPEKEIMLQEKQPVGTDKAKQETEQKEEKTSKQTNADSSEEISDQEEKQDSGSSSTDTNANSSSTSNKAEAPAAQKEEPLTEKQQNSKVEEETKKTKQNETPTKAKEKPDKSKEKEEKQDPPKKPEEPSSYVTFSVDARDIKGQIVPQTRVERKEGDTILDITRRVLKQKGIQFSVTGSNSTAYVQGIDNLYEFDEGQNSGWMIRLDGALIKQSAGATPVQDGQVIYWFYTTNYLEESGAGG